MSSLERLLGILDAFSEERPVWTSEELAGFRGHTRSTTYRYVKDLVDAGLLQAVGKGGFVLGPRIIMLDRQIRSCDPLLAASRPVIRELIEAIGDGVLLLSRLYGDKIVCIHRETGRSSLAVSYGRGHTLPLFNSSTARVVLAHLPPRTQHRLFHGNGMEIAIAGLGTEWAAFRDTLRAIRRGRICTTHAAVDPGLLCAAVPLFRAPRAVTGGLCLIQADRGQAFTSEHLGLLDEAAMRISRDMATLLGAQGRGAVPATAPMLLETA